MHTPTPSPLTERIIAWWTKKKTCVRHGCDKVCQKRFHCELSLMLGGHINPNKIPQFEHATCISENFLHSVTENSDPPRGLEHKDLPKTSDPRKTQIPGCLENSDPQYFSNIATNYRPRAASLSFPSTEAKFRFPEISPERKFALAKFRQNQILLTVCNETLCSDRYV